MNIEFKFNKIYDIIHFSYIFIDVHIKLLFIKNNLFKKDKYVALMTLTERFELIDNGKISLEYNENLKFLKSNPFDPSIFKRNIFL